MKIAISATNPCHLYDLAKAWHALDALGAYHSGYPDWRLRPPAGFPLRAHSWRTVVTYAALRLPRALRPRDPALFRWQDDGFDRAVARGLRATDGEVVHALPGQALHTFRAARRLGVETCLNHASGPLARQHAILEAVAAETGGPAPTPPSAVELERRAAETALADWHCVASGVVRDQLIADGVPADRIWLAPYAADSACFYPPRSPRPRGRRIVFAGQITARKGLPVLFAALGESAAADAPSLDCYGPSGIDAAPLIASAPRPARFHGAVSQATLGEVFRNADLLVLPSWEEAFGLVVPQALNCGLPVIVSDRVGAKDLIKPRVNGSVFPAGDPDALAREIAWWLANPDAFVHEVFDWERPARSLLNQMRDRATASPSRQS